MSAREVARNPADPLRHVKLGLALEGEGRLREAEACLRRSLALAPESADAANILGHVLRRQERLIEAEEWHRRALALKPDFVNALVHLGVTLRNQGRLAPAIDCHARALALAPRTLDALVHLGATLREAGETEAAIAVHRQALALSPGQPDAALNIAFALLSEGDLPGGSAAYECRFAGGRYPLPDHSLWDGAPLPGGTLLLWAELGFGDTIQFIRYAKLIRPRVGRLALRCHPALVALMRTMPELDDVISIEAPLPRFDAYIPLVSLMRVLGTTLATIPSQTPYLAPPPDRVTRFSGVRARGALTVGLVWAGNPGHGNDRRRSLPLTALGRLFSLPNKFRVVSVQVSAFTGTARRFDQEIRASPWADRLIDLGPTLGDFADTAAVLSSLDLLIAVDTAVVHVAGALGVKGWVLLPFNADWRWLKHRADSPWYKSLTLYRQEADFRWAPVIERVRADLEALC
ncbi:MAG TPA: tetratricopeptide repeat-containing glycosyltransferase family protein [Stellaceae bacterium]|nr:tetratricopeptide repeat-containing glycosyltransferase family protein [Stellaceae bacterium]